MLERFVCYSTVYVNSTVHFVFFDCEQRNPRNYFVVLVVVVLVVVVGVQTFIDFCLILIKLDHI